VFNFSDFFLCSLWAMCVLIGNHPENVRRLLSCTCDNWTGSSVKKFLQDLKHNKAQTEEARGHAGLILCSIKMFENSTSPEIHCHPDSEAKYQDVQSHTDDVCVDPLLNTDLDASEYMHTLYKSSNCTVMNSVDYDTSTFPELNSAPFFRFNIVGELHVKSVLESPKGVTEL